MLAAFAMLFSVVALTAGTGTGTANAATNRGGIGYMSVFSDTANDDGDTGQGGITLANLATSAGVTTDQINSRDDGNATLLGECIQGLVGDDPVPSGQTSSHQHYGLHPGGPYTKSTTFPTVSIMDVSKAPVIAKTSDNWTPFASGNKGPTFNELAFLMWWIYQPNSDGTDRTDENNAAVADVSIYAFTGQDQSFWVSSPRLALLGNNGTSLANSWNNGQAYADDDSQTATTVKDDYGQVGLLGYVTEKYKTDKYRGVSVNDPTITWYIQRFDPLNSNGTVDTTGTPEVASATGIQYAGVGFYTTTSVSLKIIKHDTNTGTALGGATVQVYSAASKDNSGSTTGKTYDSNYGSTGVTVSTLLGGYTGGLSVIPGDTYTFDETAAPANYSIPATHTFTVTVPAGQTGAYTYNFNDAALFPLVINKVDSALGTNVAGAVMSVTSSNDTSQTWPQTVTTAADGSTAVKVVPGGTYTVTEVTPPPNYLLPAVPTQTFTVPATQSAAYGVTFIDVKPVPLILAKHDFGDGSVVAGATMTIQSASDNNFGGAGQTVITAADGSTGLNVIPGDSYTITETAAPAGYLLPVPNFQNVAIPATQTTNFEVDFTDVKPVPLAITKIDATGGGIVAGATMTVQITADPTQAGTAMTGPQTVITAADGSTSLTVIPGDSYTVTETAPPPGYYLWPGEPGNKFPVSRSFTVPAAQKVPVTISFPGPRFPTLGITSQTTFAAALPGRAVSDGVHVTGLDGEGGTVAEQVFGPFTTRPTSTTVFDASNLLATLPTQTIAVTGWVQAPFSQDFTFTYTPAVPAGDSVTTELYYGFKAVVVLNPSGATATSLPSDANENYSVVAPKMSTTTSFGAGNPGDIATDGMTFTGTNESPKQDPEIASWTSTLWYVPFTSVDEPVSDIATVNWANAYRIGSPSSGNGSGASVTGDGNYTTGGVQTPTSFNAGGVTTDGTGFYSWSNTATTVTGYTFTSPVGQRSERFYIVKPLVHTQISQQSLGQAGGGVHEDVTVDDTHGAFDPAVTGAAPGSLKDQMWGPAPSATNDSTTADWAKAVAMTDGAFTYAGPLDKVGNVPTWSPVTALPIQDGSYRTSMSNTGQKDLTVPANNTQQFQFYTAVVSLTVTDPITNQPHVLYNGSLDDQTETVGLDHPNIQPSISSIASPVQAQQYSALSDQVSVTYAANATGTVQSVLYGPVTPNADGSALTKAQWAQAPQVTLAPQPITLDSDGKGVITIDAPNAANLSGAYGWGQTFTASDGAVATSFPYDVNESTLITPVSITTQVKYQAAMPGQYLQDNYTLTGVTRLPAGTAKVGTFRVQLAYMPVADFPAGAVTGSDITKAQWSDWLTKNTVADTKANTCSNSAIVWSEDDDITADVTNGVTGKYLVPDGANGGYAYIESWYPNVPGSVVPKAGTCDTNSDATATVAGEVNEVTSVTSLPLKTQVSQKTVFPSDFFYDTMLVGPSADGTTQTVVANELTYYWPTWDKTDNPAKDDWAAAIADGTATVVDSQSKIGITNSQIKFDPYQAPADATGVYSYGETAILPGDTVASGITVPGEVNETVRVGTLDLKTQVSTSVVNRLDSFYDTMQVGPSSDGSIQSVTATETTWSLPTWTDLSTQPSVDDWQAAIDAGHAVVVDTQTKTGTTNSQIKFDPYQTPADATGVYSFAESVLKAGQSIVYGVTKPGEVNETVAVGAVDVKTGVLAQTAQAGDKVGDQMWVTWTDGAQHQSGTIDAVAYYWAGATADSTVDDWQAAIDAGQATQIWSQAGIPITGKETENNPVLTDLYTVPDDEVTGAISWGEWFIPTVSGGTNGTCNNGSGNGNGNSNGGNGGGNGSTDCTHTPIALTPVGSTHEVTFVNAPPVPQVVPVPSTPAPTPELPSVTTPVPTPTTPAPKVKTHKPVPVPSVPTKPVTHKPNTGTPVTRISTGVPGNGSNGSVLWLSLGLGAGLLALLIAGGWLFRLRRKQAGQAG